MKHRTFFWFFLPTGLAMLLFIAAPIVSVVMQSMFAPHEAVLKTVENCGPFGCTEETTIDQEATRQLRAEKPLGRFNGLDIYFDRGHLAFAEVAAAWRAADVDRRFPSRLGNLPFYKAMAFTLTYTFVVTPLLIVLGLMIALAVNTLHRRLKGLVIFFSLLPMIVTPLIGSLILFWMIDSRGDHRQIHPVDPRRSRSVAQGVDLADLDHADRLRHLAFRAVCLRRVLCRAADPAPGPAGSRADRRRHALAAGPLSWSCRI
jgi:ABC-type sugar transport system permease subunit